MRSIEIPVAAILVSSVLVASCGGGGGGGAAAPPRSTVAPMLFFAADDGTHGFEPWKTDGTAAGTVMVKDINPDPALFSGWSLYPGTAFTVIDGVGYFEADDGINGVELWKSDGTAAGTAMVKDINPLISTKGPGSSSPRASPRSTAQSTSPPPTAPAASSCGRPTARKQGP